MKLRTQQEVLADAEPILRAIEKQYEKHEKYYFDYDTAKKYIGFISLLKHTDGDIAGKNFQLIPYQVKFIANVLGVKNRETKKRRYNTALLFIPKKNGKSQLVSAILVAMFFLMPQRGKEIYCGASETNQASIVYNATQSMISGAGSFLASKVQFYSSTKTMVERLSGSQKQEGVNPSIIKVLSSSADSKDGYKPLAVVMDELHAHLNGELYRIMQDGMVSQDEPLMLIPTTAGYNLMGIGYEKYQYAKKVEQGIINDESFYSMIFEGNPDNWEDEEEWKNCNPAIGYGVKLDGLRTAFTRATASGDDKISFLTKHLNCWVGSAIEFITDSVWVENNGEITEDLTKLPCYGGLDLSSTTDLSAFVKIFIGKERIYVLTRFYLPKDNLRRRARNDEVPYHSWAESKILTTTDGNVIDYDFIQKDIEEDCQKYKIKAIGFDRWNSNSLVTRLLDKRVNMIGFGQGYASMSPACKQLEKFALERKFVTDCPILRWCINNVVIMKDPAENIKFDKSKVKYRIDGAVALAMAIGMYIPDLTKEYAYSKRGIRDL